MNATTKQTWQGPELFPPAGTVVWGYNGWDLVLEVIPEDDPRLGWMAGRGAVVVVRCDETGTVAHREEVRVHCTDLRGERIMDTRS